MKKIILIIMLLIPVWCQAQFNKSMTFGKTRIVDSTGVGANWYVIQNSNVYMKDSVWIGRWLAVGKSNGGIRLDTLGEAELYFNGYEFRLVNKKAGGITLYSDKGGITIDASAGNGGDNVGFITQWIGEGNTSYTWNKTEEQSGITVMQLDTSGFNLGPNITGRPQVNAKGRLNKVHYSFVNDTNTGFHRLGNDSAAIVTGGAAQLITGATMISSVLPHYMKAGMTLDESGSIPGPDLTPTDQCRMYMKEDKLIIAFETGGPAAIEYWYLDLTTTSDQSWIYSATEP